MNDRHHLKPIGRTVIADPAKQIPASWWTGGIFAAALFIAAGSPATAQAQEGPRINVERIFITCSGCHGPDGRGGGGYGGIGADLHETELDHQGLIDVITDGRPKLSMPTFKGVLDADEIEAMATFIETNFKGKP